MQYAAPPPAAPIPPQGWVRQLDTQTGHYYFFNTATGEAMWEEEVQEAAGAVSAYGVGAGSGSSAQYEEDWSGGHVSLAEHHEEGGEGRDYESEREGGGHSEVEDDEGEGSEAEDEEATLLESGEIDSGERATSAPGLDFDPAGERRAKAEARTDRVMCAFCCCFMLHAGLCEGPGAAIEGLVRGVGYIAGALMLCAQACLRALQRRRRRGKRTGRTGTRSRTSSRGRGESSDASKRAGQHQAASEMEMVELGGTNPDADSDDSRGSAHGSGSDADDGDSNARRGDARHARIRLPFGLGFVGGIGSGSGIQRGAGLVQRAMAWMREGILFLAAALSLAVPCCVLCSYRNFRTEEPWDLEPIPTIVGCVDPRRFFVFNKGQIEWARNKDYHPEECMDNGCGCGRCSGGGSGSGAILHPLAAPASPEGELEAMEAALEAESGVVRNQAGVVVARRE